MKTPQEVAREALGADALAGIGYGKYLPYMERAIKADRAQRHPVSIDPDEAQGLADRFREAAEGDSGDAEISAAVDMAEYLESLAEEARKGCEDDSIPAVPLDVFEFIDEKIGSQDYALYTLAAHDNGGYVDVVVLTDSYDGESVYKYTRDPEGVVTWELIAARAKRSTP